jgi:hypothetical protein
MSEGGQGSQQRMMKAVPVHPVMVTLKTKRLRA